MKGACLRAALAVFLLHLPAAAVAQAERCIVPETLPSPQVKQGIPRRMAIGGYTIALSWSPEYCRFREDNPQDAIQCGGRSGRFGFILHGLWPEGRDGAWPEYCRPVAALPDALMRRHLCAMPSPDLQQHEWAKHGSCMSPAPGNYFAAASMLYRAVRYPDMAALSRRDLTAGTFAAAFAAVNRGMYPDMLRIIINRRGWLEEVRICLGRDMKLARCPGTATGARPGAPLRIWRGSR